jgi:uncharacterized protein (DUF433 family)
MESDLEMVYQAAMEQSWRTRITSNPGIFGGKPIIRGMRIRAADVLDMLSAGETRETILDQFPYLEDEYITAVLAFAAEMALASKIPAE